MNALIELVHPLDRPRPLQVRSWLGDWPRGSPERCHNSHLGGAHLKHKQEQHKNQDQQNPNYNRNRIAFVHKIISLLAAEYPAGPGESSLADRV